MLDLYCGVGSIGLYLARPARRVVGIESVPEAITYARRNAEANGITNAEFQCASVEAFSTLSFGAINPDVVVLDPPRAGLHPRLLATLRELKAPRLVYVSCNPAALARDLKALGDLYSSWPGPARGYVSTYLACRVYRNPDEHGGREQHFDGGSIDRPLIVQGDKTVLLEVDNERYEEARDELARFAELVKSPEHIHTYRIIAAVAVERRCGRPDAPTISLVCLSLRQV